MFIEKLQDVFASSCQYCFSFLIVLMFKWTCFLQETKLDRFDILVPKVSRMAPTKRKEFQQIFFLELYNWNRDK